MKRTAYVVVALGTLAASYLPSAASAATASHARHSASLPFSTITTPLAGAVAVSPVNKPSQTDTDVIPVAGDADWVVFSRPTIYDEFPTLEATPLFASDSAGQVTSLGVQPMGQGWSVAGDILTSTPPSSTPVQWVNLSNGTSGSVALPDGSYYLGATSTGWAYVNNNELFTETTAGVSTSLGYPLGNAAGEDVTSGGTGPDGALVVDSTSAVAYVKYADPTHPVVLNTLSFNHGAENTPIYMQCQALTSSAFCAVSRDTRLDYYGAGERLSLTGGAAVAVSPHATTQVFDTYAIDDSATATATYDDLTVTAPDGTDSQSDTSYSLGNPRFVTSAFGKIVETNAATSTLSTIAAPGDTPTLLIPAVPKPVEASEPSLTSGRVAYADDAANPDDAYAGVHAQPVWNDDGTIKVGGSTYIGPYPVDGEQLYEQYEIKGPIASSATVAMSFDKPHTDGPPLKFVRPVKSTSLNYGEELNLGAVSGNRALVGRRVYDSVTSAYSKDLVPHSARATALWGDEFCYVKATGAVGCIGLTSGKVTKIRRAHSGESAKQTDTGYISVYGDHVLWQDPVQSLNYRLVDLRHPTKVTSVPAAQSGVPTSNGLLVRTFDATTGTTTYSLRGYGGNAKLHTLVRVADQGATYPEDANVNVDSDVVTWLDQHGVVMAAPLPHVADRPRFLGDPIAPKKFAVGKGDKWRAYLPYSAALTSCKVTIERGHKTLANVACSKTNMKYGGVVVSWNGRDTAGKKVSAGTVTWTVHVKNADGSALAAGGAAKAVTGTITVH